MVWFMRLSGGSPTAGIEESEEGNMKKRIIDKIMVAFICCGSLNVCAAPETMPDGTVFDAEYYAEQNPDVVAVVGTDKNALYQHYLACGIAEGRAAYSVSAMAEGNVPITIPVMYSKDRYDLRTLMNNQPLVPTSTGYEFCDRLVDRILSQITTPEMSTYDKVKAAYDYIINTSCYMGYGAPDMYPDAEAVYSLSLNAKSHMEWEQWGAANAIEILAYRTGVCDDYACAFAALTRRIGLNCYTVGGAAKSSRGGYSGHTWCEMILGGKVYYFDPEIEDVVANGNKSATAKNGAIRYLYFGKLYTEKPDRYMRGGYNYVSFLPYTALTQPNSQVGYPSGIITMINEMDVDHSLKMWEDQLYVISQKAQISYQTQR